VSDLILIGGIVGISLAIFLALTAIGVFTNEARGVSRSLVIMQAFSAAPKEMQQELEPSFQERVVGPLADKVHGIARKFTAEDHNERIRTKLEIAGNPPGLTPDRVTSFKFLGFCLAFGVGFLLTRVFGAELLVTLGVCVSAAIAGYMAPNMYLYQKGYDRTQAMQRALPDAIDLLTISVESGLGFDAALSQVARNTEGPLSEEFARVLQEMQIGMGRSAALRALGDRTHVPEVKNFVSSMVQADALGIPVAQVLRVQSREIRTKRRQRAEAKAQQVAVKILVPLIFCILPCLFIAVLGPAGISIFESFSAGGL
jgi:tight adherence protein C